MTTKSKKDVPALGETVKLTADSLSELTMTEGDDGIFVLTDDIAEDDKASKDMTTEVVEAVSVADVAAKDGVSLVGFGEVGDIIVDVDEDNEYLTWLIYGKNGTGKTTILSTVDNMLILAADEGTLAIRDKAKGKAKKVKVDVWDKIESTYWLLKNGRWTDEGVYIPTKSGEFLVKSVGFDTITKLAQICLRTVVLGDKAKDRSIDVMKPTMAHWGQMSQRMQYWLLMYKDLPLQKVWLCQETANAESLEDDEFSIYPDVNKSLKNFVLSEADIIGRTYIKRLEDGKGVQFRLVTSPNDRFVTKDRTNKLSGIIANPNLETMYKKVFA